MERAATPGNLVETQWVVVAIASGLVGVVLVAMVIYLCCFNSRNKRLSSRPPQLENLSGLASNAVTPQRGLHHQQHHQSRRPSLDSNKVTIEKYPQRLPPVDYFYPPPAYDQSGTNSSNSQYRVSPHR
jgi:hypothetical protein